MNNQPKTERRATYIRPKYSVYLLFQGFLANKTEEKREKENKPGGRIPCTSSWRNSCPCRRLPAPPHSSSSYLQPLALPELGLGFSSTLGLLRGMLRMVPLGDRWSLFL
jgi:hypothetical protein